MKPLRFWSLPVIAAIYIPASEPFTTMAQMIPLTMFSNAPPIILGASSCHYPSHLGHANNLIIQNVKNVLVARIVMAFKWLRGQQRHSFLFWEKVRELKKHNEQGV